MGKPSVQVSKSETARAVFAYFSPLTLLVYLATPQGYLLDFATSYMLKDQLHASAAEVSTFRLLTAVPIYLSIVFGLTRDLWNPFGLRDRGYFLIFASGTAAVFLWLASVELTYGRLFLGMLLAMFLFRFVAAAYQGLLALIGQERLMSGRLAALWQIVSSIPSLLGAFASGWIAVHLAPSTTFLLIAAICVAIAASAGWRPRAVFEDSYDQEESQVSGIWHDIRRLLRHRAIYPAVLVQFLFQFSPGSNTPLQFYLTNHLHASDAVYGYYYGIFSVCFIPMFFLYGWLCKRVALKGLLWWGTLIAIPQMLPLAFIQSPTDALLLAAPIGMMGGLATGAYYDLAIRSCPSGLQGTLMMLIDGFLQLSYRAGDIVGAQIYLLSPEHGFLYCVLLTTFVYALILPSLFLIPRNLIVTVDGESTPGSSAQN